MVHLVNCSIPSLLWIIMLLLLRGGNSPQGPKVWQYLKLISKQQFRTFWKPTAYFRVNINILGFSELKWTRVGEFNSDDQYIYYCGQEYLKRNGVALTDNKRVQNTTRESKMQYLGANSNRQNDLCSFPRQTIHYHSNPSLCPNQLKKLKLNGSMMIYKTF